MPLAVAVFLHLVGVITMFVGIGTLVFSVVAARHARSVGELRAILGPLTAGRKIGFETIGVIDGVVIAGVLLTAIPGAYLAWRMDTFSSDWLRTATVAFLAIAPLGVFVVNPRLHGLMAAAAGPAATPLDKALLARIHSPAVPLALCMMVCTLLAIVFIMTSKPPLSGSLLAVAGGLSSGALLGLIAVRWLP